MEGNLALLPPVQREISASSRERYAVNSASNAQEEVKTWGNLNKQSKRLEEAVKKVAGYWAWRAP